MNNPPNTTPPKSSFLSAGFRLWIISLAVVLLIAMMALTLMGEWHNPATVLPVMMFAGVLGTILWLGGRLCYRWRRHWRRALFLLACFATAIALFYAEEDWRGSHAWNQFLHQAETQGYPADFASVVPPPVPDDQNFALTPLVASSYAQMIDRTGHEIRPRNTNVVNRLSMHFWLVDGSKYPSVVGDWVKGNRLDLPAWQQYYRTLATRTNLLHFSTPPQSPAADVLQVLSRFDADIEELRQDSQLPLSRFPLEYDKENPALILLPHLAALKCATQVLSLRSTAELAAGQSDQALADITLQFRLIDTIRNEPFFISHLVRMGMLQLTLQPVWEGLADHRWNDVQLEALDADLSKLDFLTDYQTGMRSDGVFVAREMNYVRGHPDDYFELSDNWSFGAQLVNPKSDLAMSVFSFCHLVPHGWYYQNQMRYARDLVEFYQPAADVKNHLFVPALLQQGDAHLTNECQHLTPYNIMECLFLQWPTAFEIGIKFAHGQSFLDLARVAVALERYRLAQGKFPNALAALSPHYLDPVPHDVIGGQPLHYRLTDDGQFVLYSIGWNERDDGGVVALTHGSTPPTDDVVPDLTQADWVWRYPPK